MAKEKKRLEPWEKWNVFLDKLIVLKDYWENEIQGTSSREIDLTTRSGGKALVLYRNSKFDMMMSRFIDYYRGQGGLENMKADGIHTEEEGDE